MKLHWPDEDVGGINCRRAEMESFIKNYQEFSNRIEAGRCLRDIRANGGQCETEATVLEPEYPDLAARIRSEEGQLWLLTKNGLYAEAAIADADGLPSVEAVRLLGIASDNPVGRWLIADALEDADFQQHIVTGLKEAFAKPHTSFCDGTNAEPSQTVNEARRIIVEARDFWKKPKNRSLRELRTVSEWASRSMPVEPALHLMAPLFRAAPEAAIILLDAMPSPLDSVLCLEVMYLEVKSFDSWARAIQYAPAAWDDEGWVGRHGVGHGLALPLLLWQAEWNLRRMPANADSGRATPQDVAKTVLDRGDGTVTAWRWCADLLGEEDPRSRDGRSGSNDGAYRAAQALAESSNWRGFNCGKGRDSLLLEAACRLSDVAEDKLPHLSSLLPTEPEDFLGASDGENLYWAAFGLTGGVGTMFEGRPTYGLVTRILSAAFWGESGSERLYRLWCDALVLRELAAGGIVKEGDTSGRCNPMYPLYLIISMGMASVEMSDQPDVDVRNVGCLLSVVDAMLAELCPLDALGYDALEAQYIDLKKSYKESSKPVEVRANPIKT